MAKVAQDKSVAREVRRRVMASKDRMWSARDFASQSSAVGQELARLVKAGELTRIRRDLYWRGTKSRFGMMSARKSETLGRLSGHAAVGATGWHASNLLGLSTQVSPVETLVVSRRPPTGLNDVRISSRAARKGRVEQKLNWLEVTLLEAVDGWDRYVELPAGQAMKRFVQLVRSEGVRVGRLVKASRTETAATRERLRAVLLEAGYKQEVQGIRRARDKRTRQRVLAVLES